MGGIANNPQLQQAIQSMGQIQQPQQPEQSLNDPLNRGGMPFQGFNPAGTDADPRRPFASPNPLQLFNPNQVYAGGTPNFDERTGTYINPPRRPIIQPGPNVFPQPRPQDSKYGQRFQRGPVPRDLTPGMVGLMQGLGGLTNRR